MITQVVSKLSDTSASTSTATHVEEYVLMSTRVMSCDLWFVNHWYENEELRVNNARVSTPPAALHLILHTPTKDVRIHLYLCILAKTPVKASKAANRDHLLASILRLCKKIHQAIPQPCTSSSTRMGNKETSQPVRSKRKDSKKYLGRFVSRHAPA